MSLENVDVIDAIGTEFESGVIVLSVIDDWDWENEQNHLHALQGKLNAYFGFVESGQLYQAYPDAEGRPLRIDIVGKHSLPQLAVNFLEKASVVASQLDITVSHRLAA